jgi:hypothetical protein
VASRVSVTSSRRVPALGENQTAESHVLLVERLLLGGWTAQVLRTAALLRLSDHLTSGVKSLDELAVATGTEPAAMARFLRACDLLGLCTDREVTSSWPRQVMRCARTSRARCARRLCC